MVSVVSEEAIGLLVENLDDGLDPFEALDIDYSEIGMVIGPLYDHDDDVWKIAVNVRPQVNEYDADLDVEYKFEGLDGGDVVDEVYPEFIRQVEERFGDRMQLQYTDPGI